MQARVGVGASTCSCAAAIPSNMTHLERARFRERSMSARLGCRCSCKFAVCSARSGSARMEPRACSSRGACCPACLTLDSRIISVIFT